MNDVKSIQAVLSDLSQPKLDAYKSLGLKDDWEMIQGYVFFLDLSSHFIIPLQLLEIALRNKMYAAISKQTKKPDWYKTVPVSKDSKGQVNKAILEAKKLATHNHDDVVCRLMFGFWVFMLDKPYRPSGGGTNLWQFIKGDVFPGITNESIPTIFDELKAANTIRNRLFHHEPLWKVSGNQNMSTAVNRIKFQYDRILKILKWISPEKYNLLIGLGFKNKFDIACDVNNFKPMPVQK